MGKNLLIYRWGSLNEALLCRAVKNLNREYIEYAREMKNYHADASFAEEFIKVIHANEIQAVISYDYFPLISMICEINKIPYISWIYDCPQYTLQSRTLRNSCNYIFCFDRIYAERLKTMGAVNCYHYPLSGIKEFSEIIRKSEGQQSAEAEQYKCDISFVGNLYNEKKNRLRNADLTPYIKGYTEGLIESQLLVYGYNFLKNSLTADAVEEIVKACDLALGNEYIQDKSQLAADAVGMEISARERELVLQKISALYPVNLYTSSKLPATLKNENVRVMGYADYETEVPLIYHNSRINLNVTSKTIESGIPQRVFDILSCGGLCLTNYQPEIAEYFTDGEELVMYTSMEDLLRKADYYLRHEEERRQIARNGCRKVLNDFELESSITGILEIVEEE